MIGASMEEVVRFVRLRAFSAFEQRPSPEELADSLSVERFRYDARSRWYPALWRFRKLRHDARIAVAVRALRLDA